MKFKIKKWMVGSISGLIVSGILINATWDFIKSSSGIILVFLVRIATLGITKLNDNIYKEIAKGLHENLSLQLYIFLTGFAVIVALFVFLKRFKIETDTINKEIFFTDLQRVKCIRIS